MCNRKLLSKAHGDFVKQYVSKGQVDVRKINNNLNWTDIFTKLHPRGELKRLRLRLLY